MYSVNPAGILANNAGVLNLDFSGEIVLGPHFNIFNDNQIAFYQKEPSLRWNLTKAKFPNSNIKIR